MKKFVVFAAILFFSASVFAQKKYVKTLDPQSSQFIQLEFEHPAEAIEWDQETVRILVDVKLKNGSDQILEQLMLAGRYKVSSKKEGDKFLIDIPGLKKDVTIGGQVLEEEIKAVVFVPEYTSVETTSADGLTSLTIMRGDEASRALAAKGLAAKSDLTFSDPFDVEVNVIATGNQTPSSTQLKAQKASLEQRIQALEQEKKQVEKKMDNLSDQ